MHLTSQEKEILNRVAHGEKQEAIASDLEISVWTVRFHLKNIRRKSGSHTTLRAALFLALNPTQSSSYKFEQLTLF
jgi:DNA-binding NarL/FixJ family response regulator